MMRLANGEIDSVNGTASCHSIKNSSEDLEMYYIAVWKFTRVNLFVCCVSICLDVIYCVLIFCFQKMRELILTSSLKVRMEAENDKLTKTLG